MDDLAELLAALPPDPTSAAVRAIRDATPSASEASRGALHDAGPVGVLALAHHANEAHRYDEADALAARAVAEPTAPAAVRAAALLEWAIAAFHRGDMRSCLDRCTDGLPLAGRLDDPILQAELEAQAAVACRQLGLRGRALRLNLAALGRLPADPAPGPERTLVSTLHNNLATLYVLQGDPASAVGHFERGLAITEADDRTSPVAVIQRVNLGKVLLKLGRPDAAAVHFEEALRRASPLGPAVELRAQEGLGHARRQQGRLAEALSIMEPVVAAWSARGDATMQATSSLTLGEVLVDLGEARAEPVLRQAYSAARDIPLPDVALGAVEALARWAEAQGRWAQACDWHRAARTLQRDRYDALRARTVEELRANHDAERRQRETAALRDHADALEDQVAERTASLRQRNVELKQARDEARRANEAKSTFLAVTSHELRTPLSGIVGYAELLLDDLQDAAPDPELIAEDVDRIHRSALRLQRLIDRILSLTHLEAGGVMLQLGEVDLSSFLADLIEPLRPVAEDAGTTLQWSVSPAAEAPCTSDPQLLGQIVDHLVENALRFTEAGTVDVRADRVGERLTLTVADTGVGVPPEAIDELFRPFHQVDMSYTRSHEGLGLGLALCQLQARALGGEVTVASTPGTGSTFLVSLPWGGPSLARSLP